MVRIGELGRRVGVSDHVLRAWERRYGLLRPVRSPGGYRLYSDADERRIRRMRAHLAAGLSAAEAARAALSEDQPSPPPLAPSGSDEGGGLAGPSRELAQSLNRLDEPGAQTALDRLLADFTMETVLRDVLLPYLHDLGTAGNAGRSASPVSTSPATCCAGGWPASPGDGGTVTGHGPSSPALPVSSTTSPS